MKKALVLYNHCLFNLRFNPFYLQVVRHLRSYVIFKARDIRQFDEEVKARVPLLHVLPNLRSK